MNRPVTEEGTARATGTKPAGAPLARLPREPPAADALETVEAAVSGRVLIWGSLPPHGRDVDLLARTPEATALATALADAGFVARGHEWARFSDCSAELVDLSHASSWGLPGAELEALFDEAVPLEGHRRVVRPASHHEILILARRMRRGGDLDDRRRARVSRALAEPGAWSEAVSRAPAWGLESALDQLASAGGGLGRRAVVGRAWAVLRRIKRAVGRLRGGALVTLSGLDGSGKSTQAAMLRETLQKLGYDAVIEWKPIDHHPLFLNRIRDAVNAVVGAFKPTRRRDGGAPAPASSASNGSNPIGRLRRQSALATQIWALVIAAASGVAQARATWPHLLRGRVVIADRYTLDSKVHLRFFYAEKRAFGLQTGMIRSLSARPWRTFLLDVDPETASRRKSDFTLEENRRRARLYREEGEASSVRSLDGERPRESLCAEIAEEVWLSLP